MDISNEDLLNSAMTNEPAVTQEVEKPQADQQEAGQPRDDHGRFASRQEEQPVEQQPPQEQSQQTEQQRIPEFRREFVSSVVRDALQANNAEWQRRFDDIARRLPQPQKEEPKPAPDVFEDPNGFLNHGVRQAIDPIQSQIGQLREFYSQREAVREHGVDKVKAAYNWIEQGVDANDPVRYSIYQRAMQSLDPYGEIVAEHQKSTVYSQIGNDPNAWFGKTLEERLASDPKFAAELLQKIQGAVQSDPQGQGNNIINVPPNLRRAPGARSGSTESGDMSNASLLAASMR